MRRRDLPARNQIPRMIAYYETQALKTKSPCRQRAALASIVYLKQLLAQYPVLVEREEKELRALRITEVPEAADRNAKQVKESL